MSPTTKHFPGEFPKATNMIMINIRTDRFPEETSWEWALRTGVDTFDSPIRANPFFSYEKDVELDVIYRLRLYESLADGTCCMFGQGKFSLTNCNASNDYPEGSVTRSADGDTMDAMLEIFVWVNPEGLVQEVVYVAV